MADLLISRDGFLNEYGVSDPNFIINSNELIKIFTRKSILNLQTIIESILKNERQYKSLKSDSEEGSILVTNGPQDLFKTFSTTFDLVKKYKYKQFYEEIFRMFKECMFLYLIGVDIVVSVRLDIYIA